MRIRCITKCEKISLHFTESYFLFNTTDRDPCHNNPCLHDGVCIADGENYRCECSRGWAGQSCEGKHILALCYDSFEHT